MKAGALVPAAKEVDPAEVLADLDPAAAVLAEALDPVVVVGQAEPAAVLAAAVVWVADPDLAGEPVGRVSHLCQVESIVS